MALDKEALISSIQAAFDAASEINVEQYTDEDTGEIDTEEFSNAVKTKMAEELAGAISSFVEGAEIEFDEASIDGASWTGNLVVSSNKLESDSGSNYLVTYDPGTVSMSDVAWFDEPTISGNVTISGGKLK